MANPLNAQMFTTGGQTPLRADPVGIDFRQRANQILPSLPGFAIQLAFPGIAHSASGPDGSRE